MIKTEIYSYNKKPTHKQITKFIDFLYENLQEFRDDRPDIEKCFDYALKETPSFGGQIIVAHDTDDNDKLSGIVVINQTGMKDYIPENILVYIAVDKDKRGRGIGKILIKKAIDITDGGIALHVEPNNPAKYLYEKVGFNNKYLEMRLKGE